ncbi:MAG: cupredoxin domain-containing protein [Parcubacteria group bacterium]|nr:cupredoxin domain-containing protein [Parcubacteria group bacterium]
MKKNIFIATVIMVVTIVGFWGYNSFFSKKTVQKKGINSPSFPKGLPITENKNSTLSTEVSVEVIENIPPASIDRNIKKNTDTSDISIVDDQKPADSGSNIEPVSSKPAEAPQDDEKSIQPPPSVPPAPTIEKKVFTLIATNWQFTPSNISVKKGDEVILKITSQEGTHGFSLPDFGIVKTLNPQETVVVEFTADKIGTFSFFCSIFCGSGHSTMRGALTVVQ